MVSTSFTILFPSTTYLVACFAMIEISQIGKVIPTRIELMPYRVGPFAKANVSLNSYVDPFKFILVIYTAICIVLNF
jgi:hypothetical protein